MISIIQKILKIEKLVNVREIALTSNFERAPLKIDENSILLEKIHKSTSN